MKKIVKGNDFTLKIPVMKSVEGQKVPFPLPACTDVQVQVCNQFKRIPLAFEVDVKEDNVLLARVEGDKMSIGTYAIEVKGKIFGNDWRSNEYPQFAIVANNADADTEFGTTDEGDNSVEMDTAMVILPPSVELSDLIGKANQALKDSKAMNATLDANEITRKDAEEQRVHNEQERVSAEQTRETAEDARMKAEVSRVSAESDRVRAEDARTEIEIERQVNELTRKDNETKRVSAELERTKAEEARVAAEDSRVNAETKRVNAETLRTNSENDRLSAEKGRVSAEDERVKAEKKRQTDTDTAIQDLNTHRTEFDDAEAARVKAENARVEAERTRQQAETDRADAEGERVKAESARADAEIKRESDFDAAIKAAEAATANAEKVNATITEGNIFEVTDKTGAKKTLDMSGLVSAQSDVARIQESMGAYSDRPDITLVAKETNKAISADGVKVAKTGWAIAEFIAEKGNIYLFKPNEVDGDVCIFAEEITNIETRGIDYTYTYNTDGTIETAKATYLGATHTYTFAYAEDKSYNITDEVGETVEALPMTYETKVGSYSPLVRLNADAELPIDGYCRYMSHFKGNSSIKIVVSYKIDAADLVMKVVRDGVFASISTQLGNLSQKEDETRKKIEELHRSYADLLFTSDWDYLFVDGKKVSVTPGEKMRVYPKFSLKIGKPQRNCPLAWCDVSNLDTSKFTDMSYMFYGCKSISNIDVSRWNVGNVTDMNGLFYGCTSLNSLNIEGWNTSSVSNMNNIFNGCNSITSLNVNNWDISNVAKIEGAFEGCLSLKSINLSNWDTRSIISMSFLFRFGSDLIVDMSGDKWAFNADVIDKSQDSYGPFYRWCDRNIKSLLLGKNFFAYDGKFNYSLGDFTSNMFKGWDKVSFKKSIVDNSYDRKANGLSVMTLKFYSTLKNYLTEQDIATITAKGYIIA